MLPQKSLPDVPPDGRELYVPLEYPERTPAVAREPQHRPPNQKQQLSSPQLVSVQPSPDLRQEEEPSPDLRQEEEPSPDCLQRTGAAGSSPLSGSLELPKRPQPLPCDSMWRLLLLAAVVAGPFVTMLVFINWLHNVIGAMVCMHWVCMTALPLVYVHLASDGFAYYRHVWQSQSRRWRLQSPWALTALVLGATGTYAGFSAFVWLASLCRVNVLQGMRSMAALNGLHLPFYALAAFGCYFVVVNPIVEELFWRIFLYRELGAGVFGSAAAGLLCVRETEPLSFFSLSKRWRPSRPVAAAAAADTPGGGGPCCRAKETLFEEMAEDPEVGAAGGYYASAGTPPPTSPPSGGAPSNSNNNSLRSIVSNNSSSSSSSSSSSRGHHQHHAVMAGGEAIAFYDLRVPLTGLLSLAVAYASYHIVVFHGLLGALYVVPSLVLITVLGLILLWLRNRARFGLLTAVGLHAGVDIGVILAYGNVLEMF